MNKLSTSLHYFRISMMWSVILVCILTFYTSNVLGFFLMSIASGQEESIINTTDLINKGKYLDNIGNYTKAYNIF